MTSSRRVEGDLPAAKQRLREAITELIEPRTQRFNNTWRHAPSLYMQLWDATGGAQGTQHGHTSRSLPPIWINALDLRTVIDERIAIEQPAFKGVPPTVGRLRCILQRKWRPQDVRWIETFCHVLDEYTNEIRQLLDPLPTKHVSAPCPRCAATTVYRKDSGGELVRQPALQITPMGCVCQACKEGWPPSRFIFLATRLLGFPSPAGMVTEPADTP